MQPPQGGFGYQHPPQQQQQPVQQPMQQPVQQYQQPVQQYQQPVQQYQQPMPQPQQQFHLVNVSAGQPVKTYHAASISLFIILLALLAPFVEFDHDDLNNKEEREFCEGFLAGMKAGASGDFDDFNPGGDECPMNGYSTIGYTVDLLDDADSSESEEDTSDDLEDDEMFFAIALFMLLFAPFVYLFSVIATAISLGMKKHPTVIGILHLVFFVIFWFCSLMGSIDVGEELTVHSNFTGFGMFICGFVGIGLLIRH